MVVPSAWQTRPAPNGVQSASTWHEARQTPPSSSAQIEPDGQSLLVVQVIVHIPLGKWPPVRHIPVQSVFAVQAAPTVLLLGPTTVMSPQEVSQATVTNRVSRERFMFRWCHQATAWLKAAPARLKAARSAVIP